MVIEPLEGPKRVFRNMGLPLPLPDEAPIDSLQLMMDAADGKNGSHRTLTDEEITANAFVFILAG